jgi:hypothetical protein
MLLHPHVSHTLANQHAHELEHAAAAARLAHAAQRTSEQRRNAPAPAHQLQPRTTLARLTHRRRRTALA